MWSRTTFDSSTRWGRARLNSFEELDAALGGFPQHGPLAQRGHTELRRSSMNLAGIVQLAVGLDQRLYVVQVVPLLERKGIAAAQLS